MKVGNDTIEAIYQKYKDNIFAIGFNYFKNPSDADDVVQETFLKLFRYQAEFESEAHLRNWLIRVAINECKRVTLSTWFKKKVSLEEYTEQIYFAQPEESEVFTAVMNLPQKYRQVIHLYYYEDYSTQEIAALLGINQSAVTTRLLRGREKLKHTLLEVWNDEHDEPSR